MASEHKFLGTNLDFKLVHYIETQFMHHVSMEKIRKDLLRGHDKNVVDMHLDYVTEHKLRTPHHGKHFRMILALIGGLFFVSMVIVLYFVFF